MPTRASIEGFLAERHVAVVGVSRFPEHFANRVAEALRAGGRTVHLVNREADEIGGVRCHRSLADVPEPLGGVLVMVGAASALDVVDECIERGVTRVWLHRGASQGACSAEAVERARAAGIDVVDGACPLMFAEPVRGVHRVHRWVAGRRVTA